MENVIIWHLKPASEKPASEDMISKIKSCRWTQ